MAELIFPNFGNALLAGSSAAYSLRRGRREADEEQRRLDARQYIDPALKGDQGAFGKLASADPAAASSIATMLGRMDATQRARAKDAAEYTAQGANAILQADPASRPAIYRQIREDGIRRGYNLDSLPPEYNPSMDGMLRTQRSMAIPILEQMKLEQAPTQVDMPGAGGAGPTATSSGAGPYAGAIAGIESAGAPNGGYGALGPPADSKGSRAYGKYQVMDFNIGPWTQEVLGKAMTPQEFLANPQAQDAVFSGKFGQYVQKYGSPQAAARAWFAGEGGMNNPNAKDVLGTSVAGYERKFLAGMPAGATPSSPLANSVPQVNTAQMPGAPAGLIPPGPPPAQMPQRGVPGPVANGPPVQLAQGDGGGQPVQASPPKRNGAFFEEDPAQHGYIMQGVRKNGITTPQVIEGGYFVYRDPRGGPGVLYKPQAAPAAPSGYRPRADGGLEAIPGGPAEQAASKASADQAQAASKASVEQANKLRDDFRSEPVVKAYRVVVPMLESARDAATRPTRAADLNLVYAFAKLMDPESVVRESETGMVVASGTVTDRLAGMLGQLNGGQTLQPETRAKLIRELESRFKSLDESYRELSESYGEIADSNGVKRSHVILPIRKPKDASKPEGGDREKLLNDARAAIQKGADPAAVAKRLKEMGVEDGL